MLCLIVVFVRRGRGRPRPPPILRSTSAPLALERPHGLIRVPVRYGPNAEGQGGRGQLLLRRRTTTAIVVIAYDVVFVVPTFVSAPEIAPIVVVDIPSISVVFSSDARQHTRN